MPHFARRFPLCHVSQPELAGLAMVAGRPGVLPTAVMKGGLDYADCMDTVSPSYRREIQTPEFGGNWTD
jgi:glycogen synthase